MSPTQMPDAARPSTASHVVSGGQRTKALIFATLGFMVTFWAWSLISPLGPHFVEEGFTDNSALLVAVPVLVGSLGRIIVGSLTDRLGGRFMMPFIAIVTVIPVLFVGFIGQYTYPALLVGGLFLGVAGTSFAVGVPYVNRWFPPQRRGFAIGVYGIGMGGTAIAAFATVPLHDIWPKLPFVLAAGVLLIYAVVAYTIMRNPPDWTPSRQSLAETTAQTMRIRLTWQACYLYALTFGGYVAFSVYLPTMLHNSYGLDPADASLRMAGFVLVAVVLRPIGGGLSDKFGAIAILSISYVLILICALVLAFDPEHFIVYTSAFILMSAALGMGAGATFALIAQHSDPAKIGSITGFVGAAGGLGGFVPPLLLGSLWSALGSYSIGLILLGGTTIIALLITLWVGREAKQRITDTEAAQ
ncbi:MFS transporter, NNP family, nitrate/nitrite transporter [Brevibacterium sp. 239c]|uniref:MFS transporter n=1 Tax=Brevibacterium sp. 239c TaxID=1965356 RepID=UPI000C44F71A|nr:MFS transporter [Brevibacterium sp. 239c]SMX98451.1 MFS transporter, NNP family, nitrate/nitrite transporter [Brevibacterium sp. 239c]